jgi:hypothetical protein
MYNTHVTGGLKHLVEVYGSKTEIKIYISCVATVIFAPLFKKGE